MCKMKDEAMFRTGELHSPCYCDADRNKAVIVGHEGVGIAAQVKPEYDATAVMAVTRQMVDLAREIDGAGSTLMVSQAAAVLDALRALPVVDSRVHADLTKVMRGEIATLTAECERLAEVRNVAWSVERNAGEAFAEFMDTPKKDGKSMQDAFNAGATWASAAPAKPEPAVEAVFFDADLAARAPAAFAKRFAELCEENRKFRTASAPAPYEVEKASPIVASWPQVIYLQSENEHGDNCEPFNPSDEITWCQDQIGSFDIKYVRADLAAPVAQPLAPSGAVLTFESLTELARQAVADGRLNWAGFKPDADGKYTVPEISPMEFNLVSLALAAQPLAGQDVRAVTPLIDELRALGLTVAVHNDYRLNGEAHTFWLLTGHDGMSYKGEGKTDAEALTHVARAAGHQFAAPSPVNPKQEQA